MKPPDFKRKNSGLHTEKVKGIIITDKCIKINSWSSREMAFTKEILIFGILAHTEEIWSIWLNDVEDGRFLVVTLRNGKIIYPEVS